MITSIHKLPFLTFQEIILTGDLSLLGEGSDLERAEAWEDILGQYAEALGEADADGYLSDRRELLFYKHQRLLVDAYVEMLKKWYVQRWADALGKIVRMKIVYTSRPEVNKLLESALLRSKGIIDIHLQALEEKVREYEAEKEKSGEGENLVPTRDFFAKVLLNLHEFSNWQFEDDKITTFQYCELLKRYKQHIAYLESQKAKQWQE